MPFFRRLLKYKEIAALLLIGIALRSFIAPGYMLDTQPADGGLVSVMLCEGPSGINALKGLSKQEDNDHHQHHHQHDNSEDHEHAVEDHGFSACNFWSSSNLSLLVDLGIFEQDNTRISAEDFLYQDVALFRINNNSRLTRAPPVLLS